MTRVVQWIGVTVLGSAIAWLLALQVIPSLVASVVDATIVACTTAVLQAAIVRAHVHALGWVMASTAAGAVMYLLTPTIGFMGGPWVLIPLMAALALLQVWLWRFAWRGERAPFRRCARNTIAAHALSGAVMWAYVLIRPVLERFELTVPYSSIHYVFACSDALLATLGSLVLVHGDDPA